jgi:hypothetical protein
MNQKIKYILLQTLPVMVISGLIVTAMVYAWNEPSQSPPQGNVPAPINVGDVGQTKTGSLSINGGFQSTGVTRLLSLTQIPSTAVLNFGNTTRQMINLWSSTPDSPAPGQYGIGIQNNTQYFRSAQNFAWYRGGTHDNTALSAGTGGSVLMSIIGSTGSVGIGTNTPSRKLQVAGQQDTASISVRNTDTINGGQTWSIFSTDSLSSSPLPKPGAFAIFDDKANVTRLSITSTGNVGIGTLVPATKLEVSGGPIKATGGLIIQTCTNTTCPTSPETGRMWLVTD